VLGYDVDAINSVQFSNHTGYSSCKGQVLNSDDLQLLIDGLRSNSLLKHSHILTGYVGSPSFLLQLVNVVKEMKSMRPSTVFVCDPVLGDAGELYVPEELMPIYRDTVIPLADVITPNQFEAELLSGMKINTEEDAAKAIDILLKAGAKTVIITSIEVGSNTLVLLGGTQEGDSVRVQFPKLPGHFTGTGDLFTALLLAWSEEGLQVACRKTIGTMLAVLNRTLKAAQAASGGKPPTVETMELQLIAGKGDIENPPPLPKIVII
jgi:pyridoxine kinase